MSQRALSVCASTQQQVSPNSGPQQAVPAKPMPSTNVFNSHVLKRRQHTQITPKPHVPQAKLLSSTIQTTLQATGIQEKGFKHPDEVEHTPAPELCARQGISILEGKRLRGGNKWCCWMSYGTETTRELQTPCHEGERCSVSHPSEGRGCAGRPERVFQAA